MTITNLMVDSGPDIYYTKGFRDVLEDHMDYLRERYSVLETINPDESWQWRGDLFGLLHARGEPRHMHWVIMRLNRWTTPLAFDQDTVAFLKPNYAEVERILQSYNSTSRIT